MIILFAIVAVVLVLTLQRRTGADRLADMKEDHRPDERLVDPDEKFHLDLTLQNTGRHYVLFARLEEQLGKAFRVYDQSARTRVNLEGGTDVSFSTWLRPHQEIKFRIPVSISARGLYPSPLKTLQRRLSGPGRAGPPGRPVPGCGRGPQGGQRPALCGCAQRLSGGCVRAAVHP